MTVRRRLTRLAGWLPLALLLLAYGLRLFRLGDQNVWWDEGLAIWAVRQSLADATLWTAADVHPPLFFWTLWAWVRLVGQSTFAARYLTVIWSVLLAALAYALGRQVGGRTAGQAAGLGALALVTLSRFMVWWSMELRMYMLAALAVLVAVYATTRWLAAWRNGPPDASTRRRVAVGALAGYIVAAVAALYTVYLTAVALLACNLAVSWHLARRWRGTPRRDWWRQALAWCAAQAVVVLLFVPWLTVALPRLKTWSVVTEPVTPGFVAQLWVTLIATGVSVALDTVRGLTGAWWLAALLLPAFLVLVRARRFRQPPPPELGEGAAERSEAGVGGLFVLFLVLPPLAVWAATQPRSIFYSPNVEARYFLPFAAPVYVLAAWVLARTWRWRPVVGAGLAAVTVALMVFVLPQHYIERRLKDAFASMSMATWSQTEPGDVVLLVSGNRYPLFLYDYDQSWDRDNGTDFTYLAPDLTASPGRPPVIPFPDKSSEPIGDNDWQGRLAQIVAEHPRVWLAEVDRQMQDPDGKVQAWLNDHSTRVLSEGYGANALHLYSRDGKPPRVTQVSGRWPGMVAAHQAMALPAVGLPVRRLLPGDEVNLSLFLVPSDPPLRPEGWLMASDGPGSQLTGVYDLAVARASASGPGSKWVQRSRLQTRADERLPGGRLGLTIDRLHDIEHLTVVGSPPVLSWRASRVGVGANFGTVGLETAAWSSRSVAPGANLFVDLYWALPLHLTESGTCQAVASRTVFVHLLGPPRPGTGDTNWAGHDGPWSGDAGRGPYRCTVFDRHVLTVDPAAPPGTYTLEAGLYDPATGERYPVSGADADPANRRVILGTVEVRP